MRKLCGCHIGLKWLAALDVQHWSPKSLVSDSKELFGRALSLHLQMINQRLTARTTAHTELAIGLSYGVRLVEQRGTVRVSKVCAILPLEH